MGNGIIKNENKEIGISLGIKKKGIGSGIGIKKKLNLGLTVAVVTIPMLKLLENI